MSKNTIYDENYRNLIGWLIAERRKKNVGQKDIANAIGFPSHTYVSKIERFSRRLDVAEYVIFCQTLELDPHDGIEILLKPRNITL